MTSSGDAPGRDLVVIGASAGGVETLRRVIAGLPADLRAAVCVVLHVSPASPSALAPILQRVTALTCRVAEDGDPLRPGEVLVAPPDRHLTVDDGRVALTLGPRENGHRPAVDTLFRSAAAARGSRVVGVVLSGTRDDGTAGLAVIKACGGAAVVQDPEEALYGGMPASALAHVTADVVAPSTRLAEAIVAIVNGEPPPEGTPPATAGRRSGGGEEGNGDALITVCPECGGTLREHAQAGMTQWRCDVGHRYSPVTLADAQAEGIEAALWAAIRALEDRRALMQRMADQCEARRQPRSARSFRRRAEAAGEDAERVRAALARAAQSTLKTVEAEADLAPDEETAA
jgi:two-component system chemotaxis response regulator CheB